MRRTTALFFLLALGTMIPAAASSPPDYSGLRARRAATELFHARLRGVAAPPGSLARLLVACGSSPGTPGCDLVLGTASAEIPLRVLLTTSDVRIPTPGETARRKLVNSPSVTIRRWVGLARRARR